MLKLCNWISLDIWLHQWNYYYITVINIISISIISTGFFRPLLWSISVQRQPLTYHNYSSHFLQFYIQQSYITYFVIYSNHILHTFWYGISKILHNFNCKNNVSEKRGNFKSDLRAKDNSWQLTLNIWAAVASGDHVQHIRTVCDKQGPHLHWTRGRNDPVDWGLREGVECSIWPPHEVWFEEVPGRTEEQEELYRGPNTPWVWSSPAL